MSYKDVDSWRTTAIILVSIAAILFLIERLWQPLLDPMFEVFIFDVPAAFSVIVYFWLRRKGDSVDKQSVALVQSTS